jgi:hypothetical protein
MVYLLYMLSITLDRAEGLLAEDSGNKAKIFNLYLRITDILVVYQLCVVLYPCNERVLVTVSYQPLAQWTFGRAGLDHSSPSSSATGLQCLAH